MKWPQRFFLRDRALSARHGKGSFARGLVLALPVAVLLWLAIFALF